MTNREFFLQRRSMESGMFEKVFRVNDDADALPTETEQDVTASASR